MSQYLLAASIVYLIESVDDVTDVRCQFSSVLLSPLLL